MAAGVVAVKSEDSARAWIEKANQLNERCRTMNERVGQILASIEQDSEGDIVVKLIQAANSMMKFATEVFNVMTKIASTINNVLDSIVSSVTDTVGKIMKFVTGG